MPVTIINVIRDDSDMGMTWITLSSSGSVPYPGTNLGINAISSPNALLTFVLTPNPRQVVNVVNQGTGNVLLTDGAGTIIFELVNPGQAVTLSYTGSGWNVLGEY